MDVAIVVAVLHIAHNILDSTLDKTLAILCFIFVSSRVKIYCYSATYFSQILTYFHSILFITVVAASSYSNEKGSVKSKHQKFSYSEILNITDNFKTIIGEGGFGKVYFGILQDQTQVAVKRLSPTSMQGYKEFQSEVRHYIQVKKQYINSYCS